MKKTGGRSTFEAANAVQVSGANTYKAVKIISILAGWLLLLALPAAAQLPISQPLPPPPGDVRQEEIRERTDKLLDDSTTQVYGPATSRYFLEGDLLNNRKTLYTIDTNHVDFHRTGYRYLNGGFYTDLGSLNTALRTLLPRRPIGVQLGYDAFTPYGVSPEEVRYYDSHSPFTQVMYVQNARGQNLLGFDLSRNVNARWNVGMHVERLFAKKQFGLGGLSQTASELGSHWNFIPYSAYRSRNDRYQLLAHLLIFEHNLRDQGGMAAGSNLARANWDSVFRNVPETAELLTAARTRQRRNRFHVYQEYVAARGLQLFHRGQLETRYDRFRDADVLRSIANGYFSGNQIDTIGFTPLQVSTEARFVQFENRFGLKGNFNGFNYRAYLRRRDYWLRQTATASIPEDTLRSSTLRRSGSEHYLGLWLNYYFRDSTFVRAEGEYLPGRDYQLEGRYQGHLLRLMAYSSLRSPTLIEQQMLSPLRTYNWQHNFKPVFTNHLEGELSLQLGRLSLRPSVQYTLIRNHIYFDTAAVARQTAVPLSVFRGRLHAGWQLGRLSTTHHLEWTAVAGADVLRVPAWQGLSQVAYDFVVKRVLYVHTGLDIQYRTGYYADFYQPAVQQFYLNDRFRVPAWATLEPFIDLRVNRVKFFFKFNNLGDGLLPRSYFLTPYHPGLKRSFVLGVNWPLFD